MHLQFREYEYRERGALGAGVAARLEAADRRLAQATNQTLFDWSRRAEVGARNYVGVFQVGGLQVEILPKTELDDAATRRNLLYMLGIAGEIPMRDRGLADLHVDRLPILEALIGLFADLLLAELRRGLDHQYVTREENSGFVRGTILVAEHLRRNLAHRERIYVAHDDFVADTWLNRVLKAASRKLLGLCRTPDIQRSLREGLLMFADVDDVVVRPADLGAVRIGRNAERFRDLFEFARIVLFEGSPAPRSGAERTFSLLVPMDVLFERFVGQLVRRNAERLGFARDRIRLQAVGARRHLLHRPADGSRHYQLNPDLLILDEQDASTARVLDTKWKRLDLAPLQRPSQADIYQLAAYSQRYQAPLSILLYPAVPGLATQDFHLDGDPQDRRIRIAFLDMNRDLRRDSPKVLRDLARVIDAPRTPASAALAEPLRDLARGLDAPVHVAG